MKKIIIDRLSIKKQHDDSNKNASDKLGAIHNRPMPALPMPALPIPALPIHHVLADIKDKLSTHNRLVLQAPPGAGKTTAVPIALRNENWLGDRQIIMLEPRRLAARNAAARMAYLLGETAGESVGYQIRQDSCFSKNTSQCQA